MKKAAAPLPATLCGIIFDCDGVILDSRSANAWYYNRILEELGLPSLTREQEAYTYMATVHQALEFITPPELRYLLPDICRQTVNYQRDAMPLVRLEDGLLDFLVWLRGLRVRMAIHTNRFNGMPAILDTFDLHRYFDPVVTAAMVRPKPEPDGVQYILEQWHMSPQSVLFVGDSLNDAYAARDAGVSFAAYRNPSLDATVRMGSFRELADILRGGPLRDACVEPV